MRSLLTQFSGFIMAGLSIALVVLGVVLWIVWGALGNKKQEVATLEREKEVQAIQIEDAATAKAVLSAHIKRLEAQHAEDTETMDFLHALPGRDVPLSDLLSATVDRLSR